MPGDRSVRLISLAGVAAGLLAAGCERPKPAFAAPPPPVVTVDHPVRRVIPKTQIFTGVTRAHATVEVRARVRGFIHKKNVEGGERVKAGYVLYEIDPRPFEAIVRQAEAELDARTATLALAETEFQRVKGLFESETATDIEFKRATADRDRAAAEVALADARADAALLDLEYTQVRAPIDGRLGIDTVDVGDLVGATEPTLLATIADDSKIYARYSLDEPTLQALRTAGDQKRPGEGGRPTILTRLGLLSEEGYPHTGEFARADLGVDPQTGTILVESVFENLDGTILPGYFARLLADFGELDALLVPEEVVLSDQVGRHVLVVNSQNIVERRAVRVGVLFERQRAIEDGLREDDRVIVNGIQRARVGAPVNPQPAGAAQSAPIGHRPAAGERNH